MPREAARQLVRSMRPVIEEHFKRHGAQAVRATIVTLTGVPDARRFTLQVIGHSITLDDLQVTLGGTIAMYDKWVGLVVGDTLSIMEMAVGDYVAFEVESDTDTPASPL